MGLKNRDFYPSKTIREDALTDFQRPDRSILQLYGIRLSLVVVLFILLIILSTYFFKIEAILGYNR